MSNSKGTGPIRNGIGMAAMRRLTQGVKPKDFKATIFRLWSFFGNDRKRLFIISIFVVLDGFIMLSIPYLLGRSVDMISNLNKPTESSLFLFLIGSIGLAYLLVALIGFGQGFAMARISQRAVASMRRTLFNKLQNLPIHFFDQKPNGEIMSRFTNDIDQMNSILSQSTLNMIQSTITITGALIMMILLSPLLTVVSVVTAPLVFLLTKAIAKRTRILFKEQQDELGALNGHIEESISGLYLVKAFNHEPHVIKGFQERNERLRVVGTKAQIISGFLMPIMNVITNIGFTAVAITGGWLAYKNLISIGVITSFLTYSKLFTRPINDLASLFNQFQSAVAGAERLFEILDEDEEVEKANLKTLHFTKGDIQFHHVHFSYPEGDSILKDIHFHAKPGSHIALVGATGAGKTTIANLITRFYDVTKGSVLIDGIDIRNYTRSSLRRQIGIVLQDAYLFTGTIRENIKYGRLDATDEEIEMAAKQANAHPFISLLPKGYDTLLADGGGSLSHGQQQLITIARAILSKPAILILDEATSSVDTRTEVTIQEAMQKIMEGRTSFVIAHRLSTIRNADQIMVIDGGRIIESGTHEALMLKDGKYVDMIQNQMKSMI